MSRSSDARTKAAAELSPAAADAGRRAAIFSCELAQRVIASGRDFAPSAGDGRCRGVRRGTARNFAQIVMEKENVGVHVSTPLDATRRLSSLTAEHAILQEQLILSEERDAAPPRPRASRRRRRGDGVRTRTAGVGAGGGHERARASAG